MPARWKTGLFVFFILAIFVMAGWLVWYLKNRTPQYATPSLPRPLPAIDLSTVITHNTTITQKAAIPPYYVLSGKVQIGTGPSYWFGFNYGDPEGETRYSLDAASVRHGTVYKEYRDRTQSVPSLGELGNDDLIYLTYYTDLAQGLVMGIVQDVAHTKDMTEFRLLDDAENTRYRVSAAAKFAVGDPSGFFAIAGKTIADIRDGSIVWASFTPLDSRGQARGNDKKDVLLTGITIRTPPYRSVRGAVRDVEAITSDAITFFLDTLAAPIRADGTTIVYRHTENLPSPVVEEYRKQSLGSAVIRSGQYVSVFLFLAGDHWQALSVGLDVPARP